MIYPSIKFIKKVLQRMIPIYYKNQTITKNMNFITKFKKKDNKIRLKMINYLLIFANLKKKFYVSVFFN